MSRPAYTPEQAKAVSVGKLDQECLDCGGGTAVSTNKCWHCGSANIRYVTHRQQGLDDPERRQFLCGSRRARPEQFAEADKARWPSGRSS